MNRTFQHHVSAQGVLTVVLLAVAALWCFLAHTGMTPLAGFLCLMLGATAVDRLVNSSYTFTPVGRLVIVRGRLGKRIEIDVKAIEAVRPIRGALFTARHIIIEYGGGKITSVQPADTNGFIAEIRRRQQHTQD